MAIVQGFLNEVNKGKGMCNCTGAPVCRKEHLVDCPDRKKIPHKHAELIKAWADGTEIQVRYFNHKVWSYWQDAPVPSFWTDSQYEYRVKPAPKPDRIHISRIALIDTGSGDQTHLCNLFDTHLGGKVEYTFDGETGKLKAVCLINA